MKGKRKKTEQINERDGFFLAAREKEVDFKWMDLKGKTVLVDHFFQPYAMFQYALKQEGLTMDDITIIDAGDVETMQKSFLAGQGDYIHLQGPYPQQLQNQQLAYVVASIGESIGEVAFSSLCADRQWLKTPNAKKFIMAYQQAMDFTINTDAEKLADLLKQGGFFKEIDQGVLKHTIQSYKDLGTWKSDISISHHSFDKLCQVFNSTEMKSRYSDMIVTL